LEERRLSPVPTLGHVVGDSRNHNSRQSCHGTNLPVSRPAVKYQSSN